MNEQIIVPTESAGHLVNVLKNRLSVVEASNEALYTQIEHQVLVISRLEKQRDELLEALEQMVSIAERVDGWESFPSAPIEVALKAIRKAKGE